MVVVTGTWKTIQEFPEYEINIEGVIRHRVTREQKGTYGDANGLEVTKFNRDGKRVLRSVEKMRRFAFSV